MSRVRYGLMALALGGFASACQCRNASGYRCRLKKDPFFQVVSSKGVDRLGQFRKMRGHQQAHSSVG